MNRRAFLGTLAGGLLAAPLAAEAQPAGRSIGLAISAGWDARTTRTSEAHFAKVYVN